MPRTLTPEEWALILERRTGIKFEDIDEETCFVSGGDIRIESTKDTANPKDNNVRLAGVVQLTWGDYAPHSHSNPGWSQKIAVEIDMDKKLLRPTNKKVRANLGEEIVPRNMNEFLEKIAELAT